MKTITSKKIGLLSAVATIAILFGTMSCNNNQKIDDSKEVAEERNDAKFDDNKMEKDAQFLVNAAEINLEEIRLGQLAQQNGTNADIRELGKTIENAHSKSLRDLSELAKAKVISIPTSPSDKSLDAYRKLMDKSGNDFDKHYANMMVDGHKDAISAFEKASTDCQDADIRAWAASSLPELRTHLDNAVVRKNKYDKL